MLQASFNMGPFPSGEPSELTLKPLVLVAMASSRGTPVQKGRRSVKLPRMQLDEWNESDESKEYVREWFEMVNFFAIFWKVKNWITTCDWHWTHFYWSWLRKHKPCSRNDEQNHEGHTQWVEVEKADIDVWTFRLNWWYICIHTPNYLFLVIYEHTWSLTFFPARLPLNVMHSSYVYIYIYMSKLRRTTQFLAISTSSRPFRTHESIPG